MKKQKTALIRITSDTKEKLDGKKVVGTETYDSVIVRMISKEDFIPCPDCFDMMRLIRHKDAKGLTIRHTFECFGCSKKFFMKELSSNRG
jgi:endonuclease III-like uncharacterized protein